MDPTLLSLLDAVPQKPPRSKLETHRELIRQLRRKGCTHRDIVRILRERVGLDLAVSTIHSFAKVRAKHRKQVQVRTPTTRTGIVREHSYESRRRCLSNCGTQSKTS
jgi:hypothetical protein